MLLFLDGFDVYSSGDQVLQRWDWATSTASAHFVFLPTGGRFGGGAFTSTTDSVSDGAYSWNRAIGKYPPAGTRTLYMGFACYSNRIANSDLDPLIEYRAPGGGVLFTLRHDMNSNRLFLRNGAGVDLATSESGVLDLDAWKYLEFGCHIDSTAGWVEVRHHGDPTPILRYDGDTRSGSSFDEIGLVIILLGTPRSNSFGDRTQITIDDFYMCDNTGSYCNGFLGDNKVVTTFPTGDASAVGYTTTNADGTSFYTEVDDDPLAGGADDEATYVQAENLGDRVLYTHDGLDETPDSIVGVAVTHRSRKTDAGSGVVAGVVKVGAQDAVGDGTPSASSYDYGQDFFPRQPNGAAWDRAAVDALEFGTELKG